MGKEEGPPEGSSACPGGVSGQFLCAETWETDLSRILKQELGVLHVCQALGSD